MIGAAKNKELTKYYGSLLLQNLISDVRMLCGLAGLIAFFILAAVAITDGTDAGLFTGGTWSVLRRFVHLGFWLVCLWGLCQPWIDFVEDREADRKRRNETIARIEQDPSWWEQRESK